MNEISIEYIKLRLQGLPSETIREVSYFIDFLSARRKKKKRQKSNKEKLLEVSVWGKKEHPSF